MLILFNEHLQEQQTPCVQADDRGLTLGHGLFETILLQHGRAPLLPLHWQRLVASSELLRIPLPFDLAGLEQQIYQLLTANDLLFGKVALRLTVTDGVSERGLLSNGKQSPTVVLTSSALPEHAPASLSLSLVNTRRNELSLSSRIKSLSYLDNILAKQEAVAKGCDEALMLNTQGFLADCAMTNLFVVRNAKVLTPRVEDGALPGVIRQVLVHELKLAEACRLSVDDLNTADSVFVTNALMGVKPVHSVDQRGFEISCPMMALLANKVSEFQFQALCQQTLKD